MTAFPRATLERGAAYAAPRLLGATLVSTIGGVVTSGRIVETEAYLPRDDPASHSAAGETARNRSMFGAAGTAYVYLIYGVHFCVNVVTGPPGRGEAVLLRALDPLEGTEAMRARRGRADLASGPGRLTRALGITLGHDGLDLLDPKSPLRLLPRRGRIPAHDVSPRIGITKAVDLPLRFVAR